jgi:hypothetical protein
MTPHFIFSEFHIFGSKLLMSASRKEKIIVTAQELDTRAFMSTDGFEKNNFIFPAGSFKFQYITQLHQTF